MHNQTDKNENIAIYTPSAGIFKGIAKLLYLQEREELGVIRCLAVYRGLYSLEMEWAHALLLHAEDLRKN